MQTESQPDPVLESAETNGPMNGPQAGRWKDWSNRLIWVSAFALVVVVSRNGWEAHQQHQRMRAVRCDQPVFDFGRAFVGDTIDQTFHVINVSRGSLQIEKVVPSCGCTVVVTEREGVATELEGTVIGPGQSFDVPVQLTLSSLEEGEFERPIEVRFTGEPRLQLTLKLKGRVSKRWIWSTETVIFDGIQANEAASRTIELTRHPDAPPGKIPQDFALSTRFLHLDVETLATSDGGPSRRFTITTVPPLPPGRQDATLYASAPGSPAPISPVRIILIVAE